MLHPPFTTTVMEEPHYESGWPVFSFSCFFHGLWSSCMYLRNSKNPSLDSCNWLQSSDHLIASSSQPAPGTLDPCYLTTSICFENQDDQLLSSHFMHASTSRFVFRIMLRFLQKISILCVYGLLYPCSLIDYFTVQPMHFRLLSPRFDY